MKKGLLLLLFFTAAKFCSAQKIDSIYFHLYTDSLKKGFYNYINVDGKTADGKWMPLSSNELDFISTDTLLKFQNNDLFIDSAYTAETVTVKAVLKTNPKVWREAVIYIRKRGFDEPLMSNKEILKEYSKPSGKKKTDN
ncbi:MAG TPA: hypothetical protein VEY10_10505 [Flavisolibacter sp.]|jgi:hypothetical protein|nr:hypothetical protein [Flavisolibacter sp.]